MAHVATYIRASTDAQETAHQNNAINDWLDEHDVDPGDVDRAADCEAELIEFASGDVDSTGSTGIAPDLLLYHAS